MAWGWGIFPNRRPRLTAFEGVPTLLHAPAGSKRPLKANCRARAESVRVRASNTRISSLGKIESPRVSGDLVFALIGDGVPFRNVAPAIAARSPARTVNRRRRNERSKEGHERCVAG